MHRSRVCRPTNARKLGSIVEDRVDAYLRSLGYRVLSRNYARRGCGEIDWIGEVWDRGTLQLVFIEVRYRACGTGEVLNFFSDQKRRRIERTALSFLRNYRGRAEAIRFDLIAVSEGEWIHMRGAW